MNTLVKKVFFICFLSLVINVSGQNSIEPVSSFSFGSNALIDDKSYSELFLRNNAAIYNDAERGDVIRFSSTDKSYAVINKNLLNTDSLTISFFLYWESEGSRAWHQLFEIYDPNTNSNLFLTPQNGWSGGQASLISDIKEYSSYEAVSATVLQKDTWMHVAVTFYGKLSTIYINGVEEVNGYMSFSPSTIKADSIFLGGNPYRSDNYYISARLDEIKVFNKALAANQVLALAQETTIPEAENMETDWETVGDAIQIEINAANKRQTIQNFGASDGWNTERIGKYWPESKKEKLAELLFSTEKDINGRPKGIGLSAWRFNIGAGTAEYGDASRISKEDRRTEGFLNADGTTYNWNRQAGQQWFLKKAATDYGVNHIIGWQNSPPVAYTDFNLGFRDYGQPWSTILKTAHYNDYARFLADVITHFEGEGVSFDYISPLNEPQYGWAPESAGGTVTQEGTPWTNQNIYDVVSAIDNEFKEREIHTKLFIAEAANVGHLLGGTGHASNQLSTFWDNSSNLSLVDKASFSNIVSYHSYFKDYGSELISLREDLYNRMRSLDTQLEAWQTEYSLLGNGYRTGYPTNYKLSEMECALSLTKVMMADLNIANTTGWQWWTTFEKGKHNGEARFCLVEAFTKSDNSDGEYHLNKLFYSFGNFSHFVRPGMTRLAVTRSDNLSLHQQLSNVIFSVYTDNQNEKLVVVGANFTDEAKEVNLALENDPDASFQNQTLYLTNRFSNLSLVDVDFPNGSFVIPSHSVVTYTANVDLPLSQNVIVTKDEVLNAWYSNSDNTINAEFCAGAFNEVKLYTLSGKLVDAVSITDNQKYVSFSRGALPSGIYFISAQGDSSFKTKKVIIT